MLSVQSEFDRLLHLQREVGMPQVVELASESERFAEHGGLQPASGFADRRVAESNSPQTSPVRL